MKVLFISQGQVHDYLSDQIFHGLRTLLGSDVVDIPHLEFMYQGTKGGGFSVWGLLPPVDVDRYDIVSQIREKRYDLIVYGDAMVCRDYLDEVAAIYPPNQVVFIDGRDDDHTYAYDTIGKGVYFKREETPGPEAFPVEFCIPAEKIRPIDVHRKNRVMAHVDPRDRSTYIYGHSETAYYDQYSDAWFGYTMKKGGWDCMRHYEIMACGCLPYFHDLESCPPQVMYWLPKQALIKARHLCDNWFNEDRNIEKWIEIMDEVRVALKCDLTTEAMAQHILDRVMS